MQTKSLFGGALKIDIPDSFTDLSTLRQVPDYQEAFVDKDGPASLVIEVLDASDSMDVVSKMTAATYLSDLLDNAVDAVNLQIEHLEKHSFTPDASVQFCSHDPLQIALLRLPSHKTDILITLARSSLSLRDIFSTFSILEYGLFGS